MYSNHQITEFGTAYRLFGLERTACPETIKRRYRALVKTWHPDRWAADERREREATAKVQAINAAFQLIRNAPLRHHVAADENPAGESPGPQDRTRPAPAAGDERIYRYKANLYKSRRRRHASPERASAFRKRSAGNFRFIVGAIGGLIPLAWLYFYGLHGFPFYACCLLVPLASGLRARWRNALEDDPAY